MHKIRLMSLLKKPLPEVEDGTSLCYCMLLSLKLVDYSEDRPTLANKEIPCKTFVRHTNGRDKVVATHNRCLCCRVHFMKRLRVVDASVMPSMTSTNTNAAVIMIAEKMADMLRKRDAAEKRDEL